MCLPSRKGRLEDHPTDRPCADGVQHHIGLLDVIPAFEIASTRPWPASGRQVICSTVKGKRAQSRPGPRKRINIGVTFCGHRAPFQQRTLALSDFRLPDSQELHLRCSLWLHCSPLAGTFVVIRFGRNSRSKFPPTRPARPTAALVKTRCAPRFAWG